MERGALEARPHPSAGDRFDNRLAGPGPGRTPPRRGGAGWRGGAGVDEGRRASGACERGHRLAESEEGARQRIRAGT